MSDYNLEFSPEAVEELGELPKIVAKRIRHKLDRLVNNADEMIHERLKGDWAGCCKLKIVPYRVIYQID